MTDSPPISSALFLGIGKGAILKVIYVKPKMLIEDHREHKSSCFIVKPLMKKSQSFEKEPGFPFTIFTRILEKNKGSISDRELEYGLGAKKKNVEKLCRDSSPQSLIQISVSFQLGWQGTFRLIRCE